MEDAIFGDFVVWKCFFELREEIGQFMEKKSKPLLEFQSLVWMQDLSFMVDITERLNNLNKTLHAAKKSCHTVSWQHTAFKLKLTLGETQLSGLDPAHFPCLKDACAPRVNVDMTHYKDKITGLLREFNQRFQIFGELETDFTVFLPPIHSQCLWSVSQHPTWNYWLAVWFRFKGRICLGGLGHIISVSPARLPQTEFVFSVISNIKQKHKHLNEILKLTAIQDMAPDIDALVKAKRCQVSGAN